MREKFSTVVEREIQKKIRLIAVQEELDIADVVERALEREVRIHDAQRAKGKN